MHSVHINAMQTQTRQLNCSQASPHVNRDCFLQVNHRFGWSFIIIVHVSSDLADIVLLLVGCRFLLCQC
jgi:hypothetical protein